MIGQFIALYKARKDRELAKRIAGEMIVEGVIDRASWPIVIAKVWLGIAIAVMVVLICLFLGIGIASHWSFTLPILPLSAAIYGIVKLWIGVNASIEHISNLAKTELSKRTAPSTYSNTPVERPTDTL